VNVKRVYDLFYTHARCGLFHAGMARTGVLLADGDPVIRPLFTESYGLAGLLVDRHKLTAAIEEHFDAYIRKLRDPDEKERRSNFRLGWEILHARTVPVGGLVEE